MTDDGPVTLRPAAMAAELAKARTEHVLVIEDDEDMREVLMEILREHGYAVRGAADGIEALEKILRTTVKPDCLLLDMGLPYLSGEGVVAALQTTAWALLPYLIITGGRPAELSPVVRRDYVFTKPINEALLLEAVPQRIAEWRARSRLPPL